jgi:hypothetical protein
MKYLWKLDGKDLHINVPVLIPVHKGRARIYVNIVGDIW